MRLFLAGALSIVVGACNLEQQGSDWSVRDSADVRVLTSTRPLWEAGEAWQIGTEPLLSIGDVEGDPTTQFQQVVGLVRLSDSVLLVGDAGSNSVRSFDESGRLRRTYGRFGDGPGEFRALQSMKRVGADSVMVLDRRLSRVTVFDSAGVVARITQLPGRFVSIHPLGQGKWLAAEEEGFFGGRLREDAPAGLHRFESIVAVLDSTAISVDTIGAFFGAEMAYFQTNGRMGALHAAYGRVLALGTHGDEVYIGTGDELAFDVYSSSGKHLRSIRARGSDRTLSSSDVSAFHDMVLAEISNPAMRDQFATHLKAAAVPGQKAAFTRLLVDPLGNVWLSDYENPYTATGIWHVFDSNGRYLGEVRAPPALRILDVGEDYVAGVWKDDMGVESVRVYRLNR